MKKILAALVTISMLSAGCNSDKTASDGSENTTRNLQPPPVNPVSVTPNNNNTSNTSNSTSPVTTATGLNPAHGEPGHRCDIPVGTPLSQAPKTTSVTTTPTVTAPTVTAPQITTTPTVQNTTTTTATAPGMNPAHGQPGHRCDIPVGQPLNSKPATTISTVPVKTN